MNRIAKGTIIALLSLFLLAMPTLGQTVEKTLQDKVHDSVALLYTQDEAGGMHMTCTATAYRKITDGYRFVSAAHCVEGDEDSEQQEIKFFLTADKKGEKNFIAANLVKAGDKTVGDDFSIFEAKTLEVFEVTPLGDSSVVKDGEKVIDVASPLGLGKQYFEGYISASKLDRPAQDAGEVKWTDVMLVSINGGPGSSGSAIVSEDQKAIVGFLVGEFRGGQMPFICVPVQKFKDFESKVDAKTYKKTERKRISFFGLFG